MPAALVHPQQLGNGQPPHPADDHHVQPAVGGVGLGGGKEAAAIGPAIADGAHQAVHGQFLVVDGKGDPAADVPAELLHDGEQVGHLAAAQGDAPELGDAVGHLRVQTRRADGGRQAQTGLQQVDGHFPARQLGIEVCELCPGAVGAQEVVAAAVGQAAHGGVGKALHAGHGFHEGAVAARRPDAQAVPCLRCLLGCGTGQFPGVARIFSGVDGIIRRAPPGPGGSGSDLRDELDGAVLLARSGVQ